MIVNGELVRGRRADEARAALRQRYHNGGDVDRDVYGRGGRYRAGDGKADERE